MVKIVIADDNVATLETIKKFLSKYEEIKIVGIAENGMEEIKYIKREQPDVIVTDIEMPIMTGIEVIEKIMNIEERPKIIVMSGTTSMEIQSKLNILPISQIFRKPLNYDELAKQIIEIGKLKNKDTQFTNFKNKDEDKNKMNKRNKILEIFHKLKK